MITLADIQTNTLDAIQAGVIDEFRKSSYLLDNLTFDPAVTPGTSGGTLTYGYTRVTTQPTAAVRAWNAAYTDQEAKKTRYTTDLVAFGGAFESDRVFAKLDGLVDEVTFQVEQKAKAGVALFHDLAINGTAAASWDGLSEALAETSTEVADEVIDLSEVDTEKEALAAVEAIEEWLQLLNATPSALLTNGAVLRALRNVGRWAGNLSKTEDAFGQGVDTFNGIPLIDLGEKPGSTADIIPTRTVEVGEEDVTDCASIYAVTFGQEAFHGITLAQPGDLVQTYLGDFEPGSTAGTVKRGEVELVAATALRATKSAGVHRAIKVA